MKKYLFIGLMILTLAVSAAGCGKNEDETLTEVEAASAAAGAVIKTDTAEETEASIQETTETSAKESETSAEETEASTQETTEPSSREEETTEKPQEETTKAPISEEQAEKLLIEEFGTVDKGSGDRNVFTYEKVVNVDGVDYYSYKWEAGDGTYLCNAFVRKDGTDIMTGIYADGKWELGSDFGDGDGDFAEGYYGFGDMDSDGEEPADDAGAEDPAE